MCHQFPQLYKGEAGKTPGIQMLPSYSGDIIWNESEQQ